MFDDEDLAQSAFDKELDELLAKNQKSLMEMHQDMKEVNKIVGEPTINVRKLNTGGRRVVLANQENLVPGESTQIDSMTSSLKTKIQNSEDIEYL